MLDFEVGRYPYRKRQLVADTVQAALAPIIVHDTSDPAIAGCVTVIVRVEAPTTDRDSTINKPSAEALATPRSHTATGVEPLSTVENRDSVAVYGDIAPERARGCATKVTG